MKNQYISRLRKAIPVVLVLGLFTSVFVGVPNAFAASYSVTYNGNGQTCGTPPSDPGAYASGNTVNVLGQNGLYKTGYTFGGWSMPTGMGPQVISSFTILTDTTLTAVWNLATFSVTYSGNGNTGVSVPIDNASYSF